MLVADASREVGAGRKDVANSILIHGGLCFAALGLVASAAMVIAAPFVTGTSGFQITFLLQLLASTLFISGIGQTYGLVLQARLEFVHGQAGKVLGRVGYLIGIVLFVFVLQEGLSGVVYAYLISSFLPVLLYTPYMVRIYARMWRERGHETWQEFFRLISRRGAWVFASDTVGGITGTLGPWIIGYFLGVSELGIVSIATLFLSQVSAFIPVSYVLRSILPRTMHDSARTHHWLMRSMKYSLWMHIVLGLGALLALVIIAPLYFPQYVAAIPLCAILSVTLIFRALGLVAIEWFYAARRQKDLFLSSSIPGIVMFVLMIPLLALFGLTGYIISYFLSSDILLLMRLRVLRRYENLTIHWSDFFVIDRQDLQFLSRAYHGTLRQLATVLPARRL